MPPRVVIAVANHKGGVGKTTTAVNLSAELARAGYRVLLCDLDPQGNASSALGRRVEEGRIGAYEVLCDDAPLEEGIEETDVPGLALLPTNQDLAGAELELAGVVGRELRLRMALETLQRPFDFVLFDTPPSLGLLTLNALVAARTVLVPVQAEFFALSGLAQLTKTISLVSRVLNRELALEGLLVTMYDARNTLCRDVDNEVRAHFGDTVFRSRVVRSVRLGEAPSHAMPACLFAPESKGTRAYALAAFELVERYHLPGDALKEPFATWLGARAGIGAGSLSALESMLERPAEKPVETSEVPA